jgi:hypothetical protein
VNSTRQRQGRLARRDAAPAHADIHLNQDPEPGSGGGSESGHFFHITGIVDTNTYLGAPRQIRQAAQLPRSNDLIGDEYIGQPGIREHLGLAQFRAKEARGAPAREIPSQPSAFQGFEMDAYLNRAIAEGGEHPLHICIDDIEIDQELR